MDRQAFNRAALGKSYTDLGLVFASETGTALDPDNVTKRFKRVLKRAGLPAATRLHDLRHSGATMLLEAGEPVPAVSEYLGHASPAITMTIYAPAVPGTSNGVAQWLVSIIRNARAAPEADSVTEAVV
ncbi:MAG: tyrosine-type recombinase/integrase [Chloroflexota bacterium]|nr:tyrosine-type recombinase/integrase [Chloroflexota bacterium]